MSNNTLRKFKRHCKKAGIKPKGTLSLHTMRKSCIQNWANYLPLNVVKELAGHADIKTTQAFYTTVDDEHREKAKRVIDELLATDARQTPEANFDAVREIG